MEKPANPWEGGWRSWVIAFGSEFVVQIIGPILLFFGVLWLLSKVYGNR